MNCRSVGTREACAPSVPPGLSINALCSAPVKQPTLVLAFAASAWLLLQPFLHWLVRWRIDTFRFTIEIVVCATFALLVAHAGQRRHANWSAVFAALAVAINPIWPIMAPERASAIIALVAGVAAAIYATRRWSSERHR